MGSGNQMGQASFDEDTIVCTGVKARRYSEATASGLISLGAGWPVTLFRLDADHRNFRIVNRGERSARQMSSHLRHDAAAWNDH